MTKRAVVVGINDYSGNIAPGRTSRMTFCVEDATSFAILLQSFGFDPSNVVSVLEGNATRDNVMSELTTAVNASEAGDVICFYFAGRGSIVAADPSDLSCSRYYSAMDMATAPDLTDRDLFSIASQLPESSVNFTAVSDSCYSGGLDQEVDIGIEYRAASLDANLLQQIQHFMDEWIPAGIGVPTDPGICKNDVSQISLSADGEHLMCSEDQGQIFVEHAKMMLIAACRFWELAHAANGHGFLTRAFLDTVTSSNFQITYGNLITTLQTRVAALYAPFLPIVIANHPDYPLTQVPQLRGQVNRMSEGFLQPWSTS
jgi:hypothetical protein